LEPIEIAQETQAEVAAECIIRDIRNGVLVPDHKLRVTELRERYGIGASPLREALSIVTSLGYATSESHRGYRVAALSPADLADITNAREIIETGMLRDSMLAHSDEWAIGIITANERLKRLVARCPANQMVPAEPIKEAHKRLHIALTAGCNSERLAKMQDLLFDQAGRYRDLMLAEVRSPQHFVDTHDALVQTVLGGDVNIACESLRDHLRRTLREVYSQKNRPT
jgi:GntR family transcriptional regulator, carbon starvation induced regulator